MDEMISEESRNFCLVHPNTLNKCIYNGAYLADFIAAMYWQLHSVSNSIIALFEANTFLHMRIWVTNCFSVRTEKGV